MLARQDAWYDRHENVDRGRFVFAALGRRWAIDRPWSQALRSEDHNLMHVDGRAQAEATVGRGKAPSGSLVLFGDIQDHAGADVISYGVLDLKNAYDWHEWTMQIPYDVEFLPQADGTVLLVEKDERQSDGRPEIGSRRLLLAPLGAGESTIRMEEYASSISRGVAHKARRLVIARQGTDARFHATLSVPQHGGSDG